jgi:chromosome segregation ATPase
MSEDLVIQNPEVKRLFEYLKARDASTQENMREIIASLKETENQLSQQDDLRSQQEKIDQLESNVTQVSQLINEVTTKTESLASELNRLSGK